MKYPYTILLGFLTLLLLAGCKTTPVFPGAVDPSLTQPATRTGGGEQPPKVDPSPPVPPKVKPGTVEFRLITDQTTVGATEYLNANDQKALYVDREILLDNGDIASAAAGRSEAGPTLQLIFTAEGKNKLAKITRDYRGKKLAILVDDQLIVAPVIQEEISGGKVTIAGSFNDAGARRIATSINSR